jgi:hypothetical protein
MEKAGGYISVQFAWSLPVPAAKLRPKHSKKRIYRNKCQIFRPDYDDLLMRNRFLRLLYVERLVFLSMRCRTYKNTDLTVSDDSREPYSNRFLKIASLAGHTRTGL